MVKKLAVFAFVVCMGFLGVVKANTVGFQTIWQNDIAPKDVRYLKIQCDTTDIDSLLARIDLYPNLSGIAFIGKCLDEEKIWKPLRRLKILEQIIFFNNGLTSVEIGASSSTVKDLWIIGSPELPSSEVNRAIVQTEYLLNLRISGIQQVPEALNVSHLKLLSSLQIANSSWSNGSIINSLLEVKTLKKLLLSDNGFQFLDKDIKKLQQLRYLDLSGNQFSELPKQFKKLKNIDTLVLNRNAIGSKEDLASVLKGIPLKMLFLDGDTGNIQQLVSYRLPGKKIKWNSDSMAHHYFELPTPITMSSSNQGDTESIQVKNKTNFNIGSSKVKLISRAYLVYDKLVFPNPLKYVDTTKFADRYSNKDYFFTYKIPYQNHTEIGMYYPLKYDKRHHKYYKKKKLKKLKQKKHSMVIFNVEELPQPNAQGRLFLTIHLKEVRVGSKVKKRKDLEAFRGMVWESTEFGGNVERFLKRFVTQKVWSDIRIYAEEGGEGLHKIVLKSRFEDDSLYLTPRKPKDLDNEKFMKKSVPKMSKRYVKNMAKQEKRYNKDLERLKQKLSRKDKKRIDVLWKKVEEYMLKEELDMGHGNWMKYYLEVKENEYALLAHAPLDLMYLSRFVGSQGIKESNGEDFFIGQKWVEFKVLKQDSSAYDFSDFCIVDIERKLIKHYEADSVNKILTEPFHRYLFIGKIKGSNSLVILQPEESTTLFQTGLILKPSNQLVSGSGTNFSFYQAHILKALQKLSY